MLLGAILVTLAVWFLVQGALAEKKASKASNVAIPTAFPETNSVPKETTPNSAEAGAAPRMQNQDTLDERIFTESAPQSIFLRDLQLSESQIRAAETFGIDVNTFEITPTMIMCAEEQVGTERLTEFKNGATPGFAEGLALFGCLE